MKLALCFVLCFCFGALAQTVTNWDLSELNAGDSGIVEADKAPQKVLDRKASNQGYQSKITKSGKQTTLELTVYKERTPRVTDVDVLLFGFEAAKDADLTNMTFSYSETSSVIASSLGSTWETQVHLPTEDLSYLELLRLAASLNEYTMIVGSNGGGPKNARDPPSDFECICHGTAHHFPVENNPGGASPFHKQWPFWGVRILKKSGNTGGHSAPGPHNNKPYNDLGVDGLYRDCVLCSKDNVKDNVHTDDFTDCRYCCFGKCVVTIPDVPNPDPATLDVCDWGFEGWTDAGADLVGYTYYPNAIGRCIKPRHLNCLEGVEEVDCTCDDVINILNLHDTETARCDTYCDKIVGWSTDFCETCQEAIESLRSELGSDSTNHCECEDAWWHQAHPGYAESGAPTEDGQDGDGEDGDGDEDQSFKSF